MANKFTCNICGKTHEYSKKHQKIAILNERAFNKCKSNIEKDPHSRYNTAYVDLADGNAKLYDVCENCLGNDVFKYTDELYEKHNIVISLSYDESITSTFEINEDLDYNACYCCHQETASDENRNTAVYISNHLIHMIKNNPQYFRLKNIQEITTIINDNTISVNVCNDCLESEIKPKQLVLDEEGIDLSPVNPHNPEDNDEDSNGKVVVQYVDGDDSETSEDEEILLSFGDNLLSPENIQKIQSNIIFGRDKEVQSIINILSKRDKNNPLLIGESGVGKTSIIHKLCLRIYNKENIPSNLEDVQIYSIRIADLVAGTKYRGDLEDKMRTLMDTVKDRKDIVLFFDEIHQLAGAGGGSPNDTITVKDILKPALSNGELTCIGATTTSEYKKYIETDSALRRRFQTIQVFEPKFDECFALLKQSKNKYESHHGIIITDDAIEEAIKLSTRYITDRQLPDKAFDLLDQAGALLKVENDTLALKAYYDKNIASLEILHDEDSAGNQKQEKLLKKINKRLVEDMTLKVDYVHHVLKDWTGIDVAKIHDEEIGSLRNVEKTLSSLVIGQESATSTITKYIQKIKLGLTDHKKPFGVYLLVGPTGTGKTELAKVTNDMLCAGKEVIRFDLSEFSEKHEASKLIGAPPGYVGYEEGGLLTERVKRNPFSVVLLDEIDKAHPDVLNVLLQVFDEGYLTDGRGDRVDFKNTMIFMTSNFIIDSKVINKEIGFTTSIEKSESETQKLLLQSLREKGLRAEFLNRIDEVILFNHLSEEAIKNICTLKMEERVKFIASNNKYIESCHYNSDVIEFLSKKGYDKEYGVRPLKRAIETYVTSALTDFLVTQPKLSQNKKISCNLVIKDDKVVVEML